MSEMTDYPACELLVLGAGCVRLFVGWAEGRDH